MLIPDLMTGVGHGALGVRSGLRGLVEFMDAASSVKIAAVELRPGVMVVDWTLDQSATYLARLDVTLDGMARDVVRVQTSDEASLARAESLALCRSTPGTYYFDPDELFDPSFDWDSSLWDIGVPNGNSLTAHYWDQFRKLYVHLTDGSDPNTLTVEASLGAYYASAPMVQPNLGPDKIVDGHFGTWTAGVPNGWSWALIGNGWTLTEITDDVPPGGKFWQMPTADVGVGTKTVQISNDLGPGATVGQGALRALDRPNFVVGAYYRFSGWYKTSPGFPGAYQATCATMYSTTDWVLSDGRSTVGGSAWQTLENTEGEWRRFTFDFRSPGPTAGVRFLLRTSAAWLTGPGVFGSAWVRLNDIKVQRIWRWNYYEPRIRQADIPATETGSNDVFFGGKRVGLGSVTLANRDAMFESMLGSTDWLNRGVIVRAGGTFPDGVGVSFESWAQQFTGQIQEVVCSDDRLSLTLQDARTFFHQKLPLRVYDDATFPTMDLQRSGNARPIFFGAVTNIDPVRCALYTNDKYGLYEIADTTDAPNGIAGFDAIYAYANAEAADRKDATQRVLLAAGTEYIAFLDEGRFRIERDVTVLQITPENNLLHFNIGGGTLVATLAVGVYVPWALAALVQIYMQDVGGTGVTCVYSDATNKFTIAKPSGTLNLLTSTGTEKDISAYPTLGFRKAADRTGVLSYVGDDAIFESADKDHILRVDARGFKDTGTGTYTGVGSALIEKGSDIARFIALRYLRQAPENVDLPTFAQARTQAPEPMAIYLKEVLSSQVIFDRLEFSNVANLIVDGAGTIFYKVYLAEVPAGILELEDRDLMSFEVKLSTSDVFRSVQIRYSQDPTTQDFLVREVTNQTVPVRFGRENPRPIETFLSGGGSISRLAPQNDASRLASRYLALAESPVRRPRFAVKGRAMALEVGDKVRLTRRRGVGPSGVLIGVVFRVISLRKNPLGGLVEIEAVDDRVAVGA